MTAGASRAPASAPADAGEDPGRLEEIELDLVLEAIHRRYGYDFRGYARASIRRRLWRRVYAEKLQTLSALQDRLLHDAQCMHRLLRDLSIHVTAMFREPEFFVVLREQVVPMLRTWPYLRIWNAGCSTGEETMSLAILLTEVGLYERTRLYATDINAGALEQAATGRFPLEKMREYTQNYLAAGGERSFSEYYEVHGDAAVFHRDLLRNVVFAQHNLVSDHSFNEFQLIVCRNVMIYFDRTLQNHVQQVFLDSLVPFGVVGLGRKESLRYAAVADHYEQVAEPEQLYRRIR